MANHANHSSHERTILWIIIPATIFVSLLFTMQNHKIVTKHSLSGSMGATKQAVEKTEMPTEPQAGATTEHAADTTHAAPKHEATH